MEKLDYLALYRFATLQDRFTSVYWRERQMIERRTYLVAASELNLLLNEVRAEYGESITFAEVHRGPTERRVLTIERLLDPDDVLPVKMMRTEVKASESIFHDPRDIVSVAQQEVEVAA
jgi:hypothetical protein